MERGGDVERGGGCGKGRGCGKGGGDMERGGDADCNKRGLLCKSILALSTCRNVPAYKKLIRSK